MALSLSLEPPKQYKPPFACDLVSYMSSSGSLQLPQAQARVTSSDASQQKPLALPTQSKNPDTSPQNTADEDDKSAVKDTQSIPAPITEQTLSNMHGIVPTLQYVSILTRACY